MNAAHEATSSQEAAPSELQRSLLVVRNRITLIASCIAVVAVTAFVFSLLQTKVYTASASLLFRDPGFAHDLFGANLQTGTDPEREAATNVKLVGLSVVAERTADALGGGLTTDAVDDAVEVSAQGTSDVVAVAATDAEPPVARRIANEFARQFITFRADADRSKLEVAKQLADEQLARLSAEGRIDAGAAALSSAAQKLGVLASLQTGNAELVQSAELPTSPSSPRPMRNTVFGAFLGLLLGLGIAFLLERLGRTIKDAEEAQEAFGIPVVGTIPKSRVIGSGTEWLPFSEAESFQTLRGALRYFNLDEELRSILVTSASAGEGKSTVAWNLAMVAASTSKTVLLEADLRKPSLAAIHSLFPQPGISELLTRQVELGDALQTLLIEPDPDSLHGGGQSLDILVAGAPPPNPAQLLEGRVMAGLIEQLLETYQLVVIDTPPVSVVADAYPLLTRVDGVIAVCRIGETTHAAAQKLQERLRHLGAPLLGVVANGIRHSRKSRRYGYGYYGVQTRGIASRPDAAYLEQMAASESNGRSEASDQESEESPAIA